MARNTTSLAQLRGHNWGFIIYKDNVDKLVNGYETVVAHLRGLNVRGALSPWHDEDTYDEEDVSAWVERHATRNGGELSDEDAERKPNVGDKEPAHLHGMLCFKGSKSAKQILEMLEPLGVWYAMKVEDKNANLRYFAHMDSPNKHPYDKESIVTFGGLDRSPLYEMSKGEQYEMLTEVIRVVKDEGFIEFCDLADYALVQPTRDMFETIVERTSFINTYLGSYMRKHDKLNRLASNGYA